MDIIRIRARERPDKRITENGVSPQRSTFKVNISRKTGSANGWIGCHDFPNVFGMKFPGVSILVPTLGTFSPAAFGGVTIPIHICSQSSLLQGFVGFSRFRVVMTRVTWSEWSGVCRRGWEKGRVELVE